MVAFLKLHAYATQQQNESDGLGDGGGGGRNRLTTLVVRRLNHVALLTFLSNFLSFFTRGEAGRRHWSRASPSLFLVLANGRRRRERPIGRKEEKRAKMRPLRKWRRGDVGGRWFFHAKAMVHRMVSTEGRERGRGEVSPPAALSPQLFATSGEERTSV